VWASALLLGSAAFLVARSDEISLPFIAIVLTAGLAAVVTAVLLRRFWRV